MTSFLVSGLAVDAATPRKVTWSSKTYGPDGPWQAITVEIGTPAQSIDAYPGGFWESLVLAPGICDNAESQPTCYAADAGLYSPGNSSSSYETGQTNGDSAFSGTQALAGDGRFYLDAYTLPGDGDDTSSVTISNVSTFVVTQGYKTLPNGTSYSAALGNIALGAGASIMSLTGLNETQTVQGSMIPWELFDDDSTSSASFGMHIGSAMLQLPGVRPIHPDLLRRSTLLTAKCFVIVIVLGRIRSGSNYRPHIRASLRGAISTHRSSGHWYWCGNR